MQTSQALAYDVFISYAHADQGWVLDQLLPTLETAGLRVCLDVRDFTPGAPTIAEIERAIVDSHKTLLVLTPDYLDSAWAEFESILIQTLDPGARQRRLIPLLLKSCTLPPRIRSLEAIDLTRPQGLALQMERLLAALRPTAMPGAEAPDDGSPTEPTTHPIGVALPEELRARFGQRALADLRTEQRALAERMKIRRHNLDLLRDQAELYGPAERPLSLLNQISALQEELADDEEHLAALEQTITLLDAAGVPNPLSLRQFEEGALTEAILEAAMVEQPFEQPFTAMEIARWLEITYPAYWSNVVAHLGAPQQAVNAVQQHLTATAQPGQGSSTRRWFLVRSGAQFRRRRY